MVHQQVKSKKEIIDFLVKTLDSILEEQERTRQKLNNVSQLLKLVTEDPDIDLDEDDVNLDEEVEFEEEDPETLEFGGVTYRIGDRVEMCCTKSKKYGKKNHVGTIEKFCDKRVKIKPLKGKVTYRKYGNFRFAEEDSE